jgi:hypothetical protein
VSQITLQLQLRCVEHVATIAYKMLHSAECHPVPDFKTSPRASSRPILLAQTLVPYATLLLLVLHTTPSSSLLLAWWKCEIV